MKIFGIEFVPLLGIPLQRRIQTLCIFYFSCEFFFLPFIYTFLFISLLFTNYYYITLIYSVYYYFDYDSPVTGGRRKEWMKKLPIWRYMVDYFPLKVVKTHDLNKDEKYIFSVHPHGITSSSTVLTFCSDSEFYKHFPDLKINMATLDAQFMFPLHRDLLLGLGVCSSSKEAITNALKRNESVTLVVGGAREALSTRPDMIRLCLKNRKGFVKLALRNGASLVPVFQFGENEIWQQTEFDENSLMRKFQNIFLKFSSFSLPIFHGRGVFNYTFGFIPFRKEITSVVGKPIQVKKIENPTDEQVEALHEKYVKSLVELFEEFNPIYGVKGAKIEIY